MSSPDTDAHVSASRLHGDLSGLMRGATVSIGMKDAFGTETAEAQWTTIRVVADNASVVLR